MLKRVLLAALLALLPVEGWAQPGPEQRIEAARRRAGQAGIPVGLLDTKIAEGRAKSVPADRIAAAVERRLDALSRARQAMTVQGRPAALTADDLSMGADALDQGVSAEVLAALSARAPNESRAVAIAALTQLVREGMASDRALERVTAALRSGPEALRQLPGQAASERGRGNAGSPPGRGSSGDPGARGRGRGRGQAGPPASVPGPRKPKPDRPGGNPNRP